MINKSKVLIVVFHLVGRVFIKVDQIRATAKVTKFA